MQVIYENGYKKLSNLTLEEVAQIKEELTFHNPAYDNMLKFSKWGVSSKIPATLKYYKVLSDGILVPKGFSTSGEVLSDDRLGLDITYPKFNLELRDIQKQAANSFKDMGTIVLSTGSGKSLLGLYLAGRLKQRALIVVNKDDLVEGWTKDAKLCYGDIEIGLVKGKSFKIGEQLTITTIQTLSRLGEEKLKKLFESISMLILDECHRAGAVSYQVLNSFSNKYALGLTATKMRNDGLVDVVDLICGKTVFDGTKLKSDAIIPPENIHIIRKSSNIFWRPSKSYYYTYSKQTVNDIYTNNMVIEKYSSEWYSKIQEYLRQGKVQEDTTLRLYKAYAKIAENNEFNNMLCNDIEQEYNKGKSCVAFFKTVEQLETVYEMLKDKCPKIQKFYGSMKDSKETVLKRAESKEVLITLATCAIASEGTNVKAWECGFLVSSIANEKDLIQILGRLRRTLDGKREVYFYDYRHPLVAGINGHGAKRDIWYKNLGINS